MSNVKLPTPTPVQLFARCVNDAQRPADYIDDWPSCGQVYQVRVLGFYAERPYGAFAPHRFEPVAEVWLN